MGIIRAVINSIGGGLADQYLEVYESSPMNDTTVFTKGVMVRSNDKRNTNRKGTQDTISNGSVIHVYPNQFMMLVEGGKIVDYTAEPGYYEVRNSEMPSMFNGNLKESVKETFSRVAYGGGVPTSQKVFFINLQEIKGIKFGTPNPINYFDNFYDAELSLRAFGTYSIKIADPIKFFVEAIPRSAESVDIADINEQYRSEFLGALMTALNQLSVDGIRISHVTSYGRELSKHMSDTLDDEWNQMRGMVVQAVGIANISYDDDSREMIKLRNQGAMLKDPTVREGYVQGSVARGMEAAGSNSSGSVAAFAGMGIGMNTTGNFMGAASQSNQAQMQQQASNQQQGWKCSCGHDGNGGNFCSECGKPKPSESGSWRCSCGKENSGKFCSECGKPRPEGKVCKECGWKAPDGENPNFCSKCGNPMGQS